MLKSELKQIIRECIDEMSDYELDEGGGTRRRREDRRAKNDNIKIVTHGRDELKQRQLAKQNRFMKPKSLKQTIQAKNYNDDRKKRSFWKKDPNITTFTRKPSGGSKERADMVRSVLANTGREIGSQPRRAPAGYPNRRLPKDKD